MTNQNPRLLTFEERIKVTDEALKEHYRLTMERKYVPSEYLLMFTEGGDADAIAFANSQAQDAKSVKAIIDEVERLGLSEAFGSIYIPEDVWQALKSGTH